MTGGAEGEFPAGVSPDLIPGAVTDGIFPEIRASKIPEEGIGAGVGPGVNVGVVVGGMGAGPLGIPAEGGLAPTVKP